MEPIPEELVEDTWQEVAAFDPRRADREMKRTAGRQKQIIGFLAAYSEDLSREAAELAYRMFSRSFGQPIRSLGGDEIEACLDQNESLLERLDGAHEKFVERVAQVESSRQPFVMRYLVETLIESDEGEDPVYLTEEESGALFLMLKTVIDVLDRATDA